MSLTCKTIYTNDKAYCFYNLDFPISNSKRIIPELDIKIDERDFSMLKSSPYRFFYAIKINDELSQLKPLTKEENKKISKIRDEIKYQPPVSLGSGSFGKVTGYSTQKYVVKEAKSSDQIPTDVVKEIAIYRYFKEITCMPKLQSFKIQPTIELQLEKGILTLRKAISRTPTELCIKLMLRIAKCMKVISSQGIVHMDLKPDNIIVISDVDVFWKNKKTEIQTFKVQIIDWGLSEIIYCKKAIKYRTGTLGYMSPEIYTLQPIDYKSDIFSLGVIFYQMYKKNDFNIFEKGSPYACIKELLVLLFRIEIGDDRKAISELEKLVHGPPQASVIKNYMKGIPDVLADLLSKMFEPNPEHRIDYDEIVLHPFFQTIKRESIPYLPVLINNMPNIPILNDPIRAQAISQLIQICNFRLQTIALTIQLTDLYIYKYKNENYFKTCVFLLLTVTKLFDDKPVEPEDIWNNPPQNIAFNINKVLQDLEGNILIPSLVSYYIIQNKNIPSFVNMAKIIGFYMRKDVYKQNFKKVDVDRLILLNLKYKDLNIRKQISVFPEDFVESGDYLVFEDFKIFKNELDNAKKGKEILV